MEADFKMIVKNVVNKGVCGVKSECGQIIEITKLGVDILIEQFYYITKGYRQIPENK